MKRIIYYNFLFVLLIALGCANGQTQTANLSAVDFFEKSKSTPSAQIIDVRTPDEYSKGHLTNAKNIDWNGDDFNDKLNAIDKSKPVFVYCLSGGRSSSAASAMRSSGFKEVYELNGGIMKWRAANLPETIEDNSISKGMTREEFNKLITSEKLVLIDFYAEWCGPCKKMKPYLEEIAIEMKDKVNVIRIDVDNNQLLCKELKIDLLPVLQLYKNKSIIWMNQGYIEKADVVKQLN